MSKAFTRESDDAPEETVSPVLAPTLPPGVKNYITPGGVRHLREELERLEKEGRPQPETSTDPNRVRRELQVHDQRLAYLRESLRTAVIVPPPSASEEQVRFGATVTVRDGLGVEERYRIVGVDETDFDRGWVGFQSPIARALLKARRGERIRFKAPNGERMLEVVAIEYE